MLWRESYQENTNYHQNRLLFMFGVSVARSRTNVPQLTNILLLSKKRCKYEIYVRSLIIEIQLNNNDDDATYAPCIYWISTRLHAAQSAHRVGSEKHGMQKSISCPGRASEHHTIIAINLNIHACDILTVRNRFIVCAMHDAVNSARCAPDPIQCLCPRSINVNVIVVWHLRRANTKMWLASQLMSLNWTLHKVYAFDRRANSRINS